ncbi:MAG TPA: DNA-processing protein DprA [Gammaproteobacteria bacterium]|nr:DNA-protecting protein DprA [Chromatiales bacterium]MCP4924373.1 DNA-protecting protein DprA [Gammaproteobacteria bacterium]MDP7295817.1 DNA-processing protein DprA [Gammaproteobacteria bacterium]MDP7659697.1 DNA-processing protein DprA [Gammaproteobacteria bacterium]HJP38134.1 DNA-processing protein DprA [Gammaproteobacteria bacterium]
MLDDAWLTLGLASGVTGSTVTALLERYGSVARAVGNSADELLAAGVTAAGVRDILAPDREQQSRCWKWLEAPQHCGITWLDSRYPPLLREIPSAPPLLFVRGDANILSLPQLSIVGSRSATPGGEATARRFAGHLAQSGFCITSGLALGIDAAAHRATLLAGGQTIAVLGSGPDIIYPRDHLRLADDIAANGALISEFAPGCTPRRSQFPRRNRIISGLALGTLVVEAGKHSGALITARNAAEQGREVFAIPGSIHNPVARGCHQLIRTGAKLVETAEDISEELGGIIAGFAATIEQNVAAHRLSPERVEDTDYQRLRSLMGWDPVTVNTLITRSGLTAEEVSSMLLILELEGYVEPLTGGLYVQREEGRSK